MEKLYETSAISVGGRDGHVRSENGVIDLNLHSPGSPAAGKGTATTPEDLFAAGWAACFNSALALAASMNHIKPTSPTTVKITVTLGKTDQGNYQLAARIKGTVPGVDHATAQKLIEQAHTLCPYSRATRGNIDVELSANK